MAMNPQMGILLPVLCCCFFFLISLSAAEIPLNSTLYASNQNQTWTSDNDTFSLGLVPDSSSSFLAAITYAGGSVIVWSTRATVDSSGSLRLLPTGNLVLAYGNGSTVWSSNTSSMGVTSAYLDDTGNLILRNATSAAVWSSFDHPTDTVVPSQNFSSGMELTNGPYSFSLLSNGNLTLTWNGNGSGGNIVYWNQGLNSSVEANLTSPTLNLQATGILYISDPSLNGTAILYYSSDYAEGSDILRFLRLDSDGNLRIYSSARGSGTTNMRWAAVDQCRVFGYCGNFGICSYNEDSDPICGCPSQNFKLLDPVDSRKGCKRTMEIADCSGSATMLPLDHSVFLTYLPELASEDFSTAISGCRLNCLNSPTCNASTSLSDGSGTCYMKTGDYVSGYQNPALPSTSFVKVCGPVRPNPSTLQGGRSKGLRGWLVAVVVLGTILGLILVEGSLWYWCFRNNPSFGGFSSQYALLEYASGAPVQFAYRELQRSTKGFKEKLGAGGFGAVYRGVLANRTVVAVKQLEGIEQGERQFRMEVATISSTHHLNLVRLIGFCSEGRHRLLVYEFMKNGSLDNFLFSGGEDVSGKFLSWGKRFNIALGTARGITYLHEECRDCIVHCDIKPENILLDENFNAKVSDFGLAKLVNPKDHRYRTLKSIRGTRGYLAPEWLANLLITSKSDVYSYGMVLLEIIGGRRNFDVSPETNQRKYSVWAYEEFEKGNVEAVMDKRLREQPDLDMAQVVRALQVSFWCIQEQPSHRPTMGRVVQMLEGIAEVEKPPAPKTAAVVVVEGSSVGGSSINISSNVSTLSTFAAASAPAPSSSSSFQTVGLSPLASSGRIRNHPEKASSSLLGSDSK